MRTIGLEGMRFNAHIGIHPEEKVLGNEIEVNIYVTLNTEGLKHDQLEETLDYVKIYETIKNIVHERMRLLETACTKIQLAIAELSDDVTKVKVRIAKLYPPIAGSRIEKFFVEDEWVR